MIVASEHVMPEARVEDQLRYFSRPVLEYVEPRTMLVTRRLHWQPSTALQGVGTGWLVGRYIYFWGTAFHIASRSVVQSARIGFGAK